jgi:hypothetical protein
MAAAGYHHTKARVARLLVSAIAAALLPVGLARADPNRPDLPLASKARDRDAVSPSFLTPAQVRARLVARARENHYRAPAVLLDRFDVFSPGSLNHRRADVLVVRPALSSLPLGILEVAGQARRDVHEIRQVTIAGLPRFWVEPGAEGISMYTVVGGQAFGDTTANLAQSTAQGTSLNLSLKSGRRDVVGVVPDTNASIRVRTRSGSIQKIPVIDGVYLVPAGEHHIYIRGI